MFNSCFDAWLNGRPLPEGFSRDQSRSRPFFLHAETGTKSKEEDFWNWKKLTTEVPLECGATAPILNSILLCVQNKTRPLPFTVEQCRGLGREGVRNDFRYGLPSYFDHCEILDWLGCDELIKDSLRYMDGHKSKKVISSDGHVVALPRLVVKNSSVLKDDELMEVDNIPVPFTRIEIRRCCSMSFTVLLNYRFFDFMGCVNLVPKIAILTRNDWKQVLTFKPCFEQEVSGFRLIDGKLIKNKLPQNQIVLTKDEAGNVYLHAPSCYEVEVYCKPLIELVSQIRLTTETRKLRGVIDKMRPKKFLHVHGEYDVDSKELEICRLTRWKLPTSIFINGQHQTKWRGRYEFDSLTNVDISQFVGSNLTIENSKFVFEY